MALLTTFMVTAWVLFWFALVGLYAPGVALGHAEGRSPLTSLGPALVCSWLTIAACVPLATALHGFNWVTALLIPAICPAALWLWRHRGAHAVAFRDVVRSLVGRMVTRVVAPYPRFKVRDWGVPIVGLPLLSLWPPLAEGLDVRLPVPADFDTLWHTRQLLAGAAAVCDPLASLAAVLTRLSAANPLRVAGAIRVALMALTAGAAVILIAELRGRRRTVANLRLKPPSEGPAGQSGESSLLACSTVSDTLLVIVPLALAMCVGWAPAATWALALATLIAANSWLVWIRHRRSRDAWYATAALALAAGQLVPFSGNPDVLLRVSRTAEYLEHRAAAQQALRLERSLSGVDWVLVGPPEQELEVGSERFYDLSRFVSRFRDRAADPSFRFDLGGRRIYVFVEQRPLNPLASALDVQFVAAQPASYRVGHERFRLSRLARQVCDNYRRTHAGVTIAYDDEALRVYQIEP